MKITRQITQHLPWAEDWYVGQYQPSRDEMDLYKRLWVALFQAEVARQRRVMDVTMRCIQWVLTVSIAAFIAAMIYHVVSR